MPDRAYAAANVQRRMQQLQQQKAEQAMMVQQYQQQMMAQQQAQQVAAYQQQAAAQQYQQAVYQQAAQQKAAQEYAVYKQAMEEAMAKKQAEEAAVQQVQQIVVQQQAQAAMVQQVVAQKQMADVVAYKQAAEAKVTQETAQQAQVNAEIRQYADLMAKRKAMMAAQTSMAQQAMTEKQLMESAAYQKAAAMKNHAQSEAAVHDDTIRRLTSAKTAAQGMAAGTNPAGNPGNNTDLSAEPESVVDLSDLWDALDHRAHAWIQIVDNEVKLLTVSEYIDRFRKIGTRIKRSPGEYVGMIDALLRNTPEMAETPFANVLSYAAIVEYDFDNGTNKDELAKNLLGQNFLANKQRVQGR